MSSEDTIEELKSNWKAKITKAIKSLDYENEKVQALLKEKEVIEIDMMTSNETSNNVYPSILDKNLNDKIARKVEFNENKYDPIDYTSLGKIANEQCSTRDFELAPHQIFVRNFLSHLTPYNGLLLFHGLGTGKTCSAISVCEDIRHYMKKLDLSNKIIILANPNVQVNFKKQLFNADNLKKINDTWTLTGCLGQRLLKEIPFVDSLSKEDVVKQTNNIIKNNYNILGYRAFAGNVANLRKSLSKKLFKKKLQSEYSNTLLVIDEVHNIKEAIQEKHVVTSIQDVIKYSKNLKLLFLSATPMYNSHTEIVFMLKLLNMNDKRPIVKMNDIFDNKGNFLLDENGENVGKQRLIDKSRGYVSYVRGENVLTFPYRIFPYYFDKTSSIKNESYLYPLTQINGIQIVDGIQYMDIYINTADIYQAICYLYLTNDIPLQENEIEGGIGWKHIIKPLECLNIVYPNAKIDEYIEKHKNKSEFLDFDNFPKVNINDIIGQKGLSSCMHFTKQLSNFRYKSNKTHIFNPENLPKYSCKIHKIVQSILNSSGVVLVYSQYIQGGCIPIALALESVGFTRYKNKSLFENPPTDPINVNTMKTNENNMDFKPAKYTFVTGNQNLSKDSSRDIDVATDEKNVNGENIKVIIISDAGSEGIDFKFIRQIHILDPWYNNNKNEQIIGRAVRYCSHSALPLNERNVEIYLHGTRINESRMEPIDMYVHRLAERKSRKIGEITRILKENSVDCILNTNLSQMSTDIVKQSIDLKLSNGKVIKYDIGDKPFTANCDYLESCQYTCKPNTKLSDLDTTDKYTYRKEYIEFSNDKIIQKIKDLFRTKFVYAYDDMKNELNIHQDYTDLQIRYALDILTKEKNEFVKDMFNRVGKIVHIDPYYMFQPIETNAPITYFERSRPLDYKPRSIIMDIEKIKNEVTVSTINVFDNMVEKYNSTQKKPVKKPNFMTWYEICYFVVPKFSQKINISQDETMKYVLEHIFDCLHTKEKQFVIHELFIKNYQHSEFDDQIKYLKSYIKKEYTIDLNASTYFWLYKEKKHIFYQISKDELKIVEPLISEALHQKIQNQHSTNKYGSIYGYIDLIQIDNPQFTIKKQKNKGTGKTCENHAKYMIEKIIKETHPDFQYSKEESKATNKLQLCCELELILRYYRTIEHENKKWFLNYETHKYIN